jgi:hypothetical protein
MCTTHPSSVSSSLGVNLKDSGENDIDSYSYFDNASDKEKEENYFKELDSDFHDNIIEKSKDGYYGKVFHTYLNLLNINSLMTY